MIATLPELYPDELLYSWYARYKERMGYLHDADVWQDLFGNSNHKPNILTHDDLTVLARNVPSAWMQDHESLINNHTAVPYLLAFADEHYVRSLTQPEGPMSERNNRHTRFERDRMRIGLFYCPACTQYDIERFGEAYWHRAHQLPGVYICAEHDMFLEIDKAPRLEHGRHIGLTPTPTASDVAPTKRLVDTNPGHRLLKRLANDSTLLLQSRPGDFPLSNMTKAFRNARHALSKLGWKARGDRNRRDELLALTFHPEITKSCHFPGPKKHRLSWIAAFTSPRGHVHAIAVLLASYAVGIQLDALATGQLTKPLTSRLPTGAARSSGAPPLPITSAIGIDVDQPISYPECIRPYALLALTKIPKATNIGRNDPKLLRQDLARRSRVAWCERAEQVIAALRSDNIWITRSKIWQELGVSREQFERLLHETPDLEKRISEACQTSLQYAKSRAAALVREMVHRGERPTAGVICREIGGRYHRTQLEGFIKARIRHELENLAHDVRVGSDNQGNGAA